MAKKKRTYNTNLIRVTQCYTVVDIAELFDLHIRTVQIWIKRGLKVIEWSQKPYRVRGEDLKDFLKERRRKMRHPLKGGEFFCTNCRCARPSHRKKIKAEITQRKIGKSQIFAIIRGVCKVCNRPMQRFSTKKQVLELKKKGVIVSVYEILLIDIGGNTINTDIEGGNDEKV